MPTHYTHSSRAILMCYNSAREKTGGLKTSLVPTIVATEGYFVLAQAYDYEQE